MSSDMSEAVSDGEAKISSKLNKVVERLKDVSREPSPEPLSPASSVKDEGKAGGSSRRKPKVTHKVVDTDDDGAVSADDEDDGGEPPFKTYKDANGVTGEEESKNNEAKEHNDSIAVDEQGNPILPEGTVMVEPEPVDEKKPRFQGPEFDRKARKRQSSGEMEIVHCTACWKQINTNVADSVLQHPVLKVLLCRRCFGWYLSDAISKDEDGDDEQCTWCGDGGDLFVCDCHHAFCRKCIQRNMGRGELKKIENDDNWKCYICESGPLEKLIKECDRVIELVEEVAKKRKELKKEKERLKREQIQKKEERAKAKAASSKTSTPKKSPSKTAIQPVSQQIVQQLLAQNKGQMMMQARGQPGKLVMVPKGTKPGTVFTTPQGKVVLDAYSGVSNSPSPKQPQSAKLDFLVTIENVEPTLEKALASTDSLAMLLKTLKDDLKVAKTQGLDTGKATSIKLEVAKKVRRALDAQARTLNELQLFTRRTAAPPQTQRPIQMAQTSMKSSAEAKPPRVEDLPELAGMNIGQVVTPSGLNSAVGNNMIIAKETLSSSIQLVTLNDGRVLAVQTGPVAGARKPGVTAIKKTPANTGEVIELDTSDEDSPKKDSPPPKKYKPGPKCSKVNRPGPKCSKVNVQSGQSDESKKDKFKMRISLGARSFPNATGSKDSDSDRSNSSDDKPLKPESKAQDSKKNENDESDEEGKQSTPEQDNKDSDNNSKRDKDDDNSNSKGSSGSNNNNDSKDSKGGEKDDSNEKDGDAESNEKKGTERNTEDEQMDGEEECVQLDGTDADGLGIHNSELTSDAKDDSDKSMDASEQDVNSDEEPENQPMEGEKNDDVNDNSEARQALLADDSSEEENLQMATSSEKTNFRKSKKSSPPNDDIPDESNTAKAKKSKLKLKQKSGKRDLTNGESKESKEQKGRNALLADDSSDGENKPSSPKRGSKERSSLLAGDSDNEKLQSDDYDKENKHVPTGRKMKGKHKSSKNVDSDEAEDAEGFVVLGKYNSITQKIDQLDDDILEQLDGAGRGLAVMKENGKQESNDEATADSMEESDSEDNRGKGTKDKGNDKSSTKFTTKNVKKSGACNETESSDSDEERTTKRKRKTTKKVKNSSDEMSGVNAMDSSDDDFERSTSPRRPQRKTKTQANREKTLASVRQKRAQMKEKDNAKKKAVLTSDSEGESRETSKGKPKNKRKGLDSNDGDSPVASDDGGKSKAKISSKRSRKVKHDSDSLGSDLDAEISKIENTSRSPGKKVVVVKPLEDEEMLKPDGNKSDSDSERGSDGCNRREVRKEKASDKKKVTDNATQGKANKKRQNEKSEEKSTDSSSEDECPSAAEDEGDDVVDEVDDEMDEEKKKEIAGKKKKAKEIEAKLEKEGKDRKALLDSDSEASDNASDSDESDMDVKEKKKQKKSSKKEKKAIIKKLVIQLSDCESESFKTRRVKSTKPKKITIDISSPSDSSADEKKKKGKKNKKKADSDSDFLSDKEKKGKKKAGSDSEFLSDNSDFMPTKKKKKKRKRETSSDDDSDSDEDSKKKKKGKGKKKRRRIKKMSSSNEESGAGEEDGSDDELGSPTSGKRKKIRKLLKDKKLKKETKSAAKAEEERRERIKERQKLYNEEVEIDAKTNQQITTKCVLETTDDDDKEPLIEVSPGLIRKLKPHQVEAVKFLWDSCCESVKRINKDPGAGCILAHCMGLGKTLSMISFMHTLMRNEEQTGVQTCLVISPLNTVLNWQREWVMWSENVPDDEIFDVYEMSGAKTSWARTDILEAWHRGGGLLIIGYEMYRNLTLHRFIKSKKQKKIIEEKLVDPGPDIVVCDEGHILKNSESAISKAVSRIRTRRRVVLTGTPLQNNLIEYHCMVNFVKPNLLGTLKEFRNRFVNPMTNGQCADSTSYDVKLMKRRAHILHESLDGCVQRRDYSALAKFLPPKHEYVVFIRLTKVQIALYRKYLENSGQGMDVVGKGAKLFSDYQNLMKIWTHPWVLKLAEVRDENKKGYDEDSMDSFIDDDDDESEMSFRSSEDEDGETPAAASSSRGSRKTRSTRSTRNSARRKKSTSDSDDSDSDGSTRRKLKKEMRNSDSDREVMKQWKSRSRGGDESGTYGRDRNDLPPEEQPDNKVSDQWWAEFVSEEDQYKVELSGKLALLSEVLKMCESIGDKVLIFSQSLLSLDLIEDFLSHWNDLIHAKAAEANDGEVPVGINGWINGLDYFRMDGSTSAQNRKRCSDIFNEEDNIRARLFLISTKAGSLGTNMVGANRVIIFDASWNPSHDVQSIFRVYRFGQTKPCYIYRFLAQGTMEEKIYGRQVSKQSLSARVVDEHQIDRHFTYADLKELYNFQPVEGEAEEVPALPKDRLLAELLQTKKEFIHKYHEHDSLLENKKGEELSEEERKAAWEEYENEKKGIINTAAARFGGGMGQEQQGFGGMIMQMRQQALMQQMGIPTAAAPVMSAGMGMMGAPMNYGGGLGMNIEGVCRSIMTANPGISQEELQKRIESYLTIQYSGNELMAIAQQQQQLQQRKAMEEHKLRMMQQRNAQLRQELLSTANSGGVVASQFLQAGQSSTAGAVPTRLVQNVSGSSSDSPGESSTTTLQNLLNK